jgi:hypothetical protein
VIHRTHESGLVLAEQSGDWAALERELKRRDPLLSLEGLIAPKWGRLLWRVRREAGPGRPETVFFWMNTTTGEPYPLSSGLLDEFDRQDKNNTRRDYKDEDELEERRQAERARQLERDNEGIYDNWAFRHGRPVLPRSQSLRMSRDKRRAKGEKI